jgi:hypothetical protein
MVRVLGDVSGLAKSMQTVGSNAKEGAGKASAAFGTLLSTLNRTGVLGPLGEALDTVNEGFGHIVEHGKTVSDVMLGAGGALAGVGVAFSVLGSKEQAAHQQLQAAISATGHSYSEYGDEIEKAVKHNENLGVSSEKTQNALQVLTQATHDPAEALKLLGETTDVAAAKHEDLNQAAMDVGKVYNGNTRLLKEYGVSVDKTTHLTKDHKTATQALADVVKGQAAASTDTFMGRLDVLKTKIEDHVAVYGQKYGPALQGVGSAMAGLGSVIKITQAATEALSGASKAAAAAEDAQAAAEVGAEAAGAPLIIIVLAVVAAVAALIAIAYVLYRNWSTIWGGIKDAAKAVWDWIKDNWPLLLAIILGPVGVAAGLVIKHWRSIKDAAVDVWNWITGTWTKLTGYIIGPIKAAWDWISGTVGTVKGWFTDLVGHITSVFSGVVNVIESPFRTAFNFVADAWNNTVGSISFKVPGWVPGLGGKGFSMPHILHFQAGGIMPYTGLAYLHKDETVIPAGTPARAGPAVVINTAHFSSEVDVDLFMRRAAWTVQTQRV